MVLLIGRSQYNVEQYRAKTIGTVLYELARNLRCVQRVMSFLALLPWGLGRGNLHLRGGFELYRANLCVGRYVRMGGRGKSLHMCRRWGLGFDRGSI